MKAAKIFLALCFVAICLSSYRAPQKEAGAVPYITFVNDAGDERTMPLIETKAADWKDVVKSAEFRRADSPIFVEGMLVYTPKGGNSVFFNFDKAYSFTTLIGKFAAENTISVGDLLVLDHLRQEGAGKDDSPWVHPIRQ